MYEFNVETRTAKEVRHQIKDLGTDYWRMCQIGRQVYINGGIAPVESQSYRLDKGKDNIMRLTKMRLMLYPRIKHSLCTDGKSLFVSGGITDIGTKEPKTIVTATAEVFDTLIN